MFVTNFTMASQSAWHPELSDSGIYGSSDNFSESQVYIDTSLDAGEFWYQHLVRISRRVANGLKWDIIRLEEHLRELKLEYDYFTSLKAVLAGPKIHNGSRSSERMTPAMELEPSAKHER